MQNNLKNLLSPELLRPWHIVFELGALCSGSAMFAVTYLAICIVTYVFSYKQITKHFYSSLTNCNRRWVKLF